MPQAYWIIPLEGGHGPVDPGYGRPGGGGPVDPGYGRPGWSPVDPGWGQSGGERPDNTLPPGAEPRGTPVSEDIYQPAPIPEEIASQYVVSVYDPKTMQWTTKSYAPR